MKNKNGQVYAASLIPTDIQSMNVMRQRAKQLSKVELIKHVEHEEVDYIKFKLGDNELYGIPFQSVKEVINDFNMTSVPRARSYVAGVMNWRGSLLTLLDLKKYFNFNISSNQSYCCILVVSSQNTTMGILTDTIVGSDQYNSAMLEPALLTNGHIETDMVIGLHQGMTTIINVDEVIRKINVDASRRTS